MFVVTGFEVSFGFSNVSFTEVTAWNRINNALSRLYIHGSLMEVRRLPMGAPNLLIVPGAIYPCYAALVL